MITNKKTDQTPYKWIYGLENNEEIYYDKTITIFYDFTTYCYKHDNLQVPIKLQEGLLKIKEFLWNDLKNVCPPCPVKGAHIEFIYENEVYSISPETFELSFGKVPGFYGYEHAYFECQSANIKQMLNELLGIKYMHYIGFID